MKERIKCEMDPETYAKIPKELRDEIEIKLIYRPNFPYENYSDWVELKSKLKEGYKDYKRLKNLEFEIIQKLKY